MKYILAVFVVILSFSVSAQSNYYPGYVLKNNGDTLKGYVNYHEWTHSPRIIDFKSEKSDKKTQHFEPTTIKGFQIDGKETYISYIGTITMGETVLANLQVGVDTSVATDTTFLRQLVTGKHLTLYYQNDQIKTRFFISESNNVPFELKYYEYLDESKQEKYSATYKGQLLLYVTKFSPENKKIIRKIDEATYDENAIKSIVNDLNENRNAVIKKPFSRFYIGAGVNSTITEVENLYGNSGTQRFSSIGPKINAGIDIFTNPAIQQLVFRLELSFYFITPTFKGIPKSENNPFDSYTTYSSYSFDQYTSAITPQVLFNVYNKNNFKIYIDAGIGFNFSNYTNNQLTLVQTPQENPYKLENYWVSFPIQAGVLLDRKFEICLTYTGYAPFTTYESFSAASKSTSLGVKYLFGK